MKFLWVILCLGLGIFFFNGCLELVRRPSPSAPSREAVASPPAKEEASANGNRHSDTAVKNDRGTGLPDNDVPPVVKTVESGEAAGRSRSQQQTTRQVNEYALWCIERSMWNEARSHLERALAHDSLSASLHNNLAIVYEHFGLIDQAVDFYRRAGELSSGKDYYQANLERLERYRQVEADTTGQVNIFDSRQRAPDRQRRESYRQSQPFFERE